MSKFSKHLYHPQYSGGGGARQNLYRLNEFDAASLGQMASQLTSMVPDASMIAPMMTAAATGILGNYAGGKLGKLNPINKIETAAHQALDRTKAGQWLNDKIDRASNFMDKKLKISSSEPALTPALRTAIKMEVNQQLNARNSSRGNSTPPPAPSTSSTTSARPPTTNTSSSTRA